MANFVLEHPIPVVIKKIMDENLSGELIVKSETFEKRLSFIDGALVATGSSLKHEKIGGILFLIGKINEDQYNEINDLVQDQQEKLGKILVKRGIINDDELFSALIYKARFIALSTFSLESGEWEFINKVPEIPDNVGFSIGLQGVLAEGARKIENLAYFRSKIFYHSPKTKNISQSAIKLLTDEEIDLYNNLKKYPHMSNEEIISKLNLVPDFYWEKMVLFQMLNIIDFAECKLNYNKAEDVRYLLQLHEKIKENKLNYFELLEVEENADPEVFREKFQKLSQTIHPDRFGSALAPEIKKIAHFISDEIESAYKKAVEMEGKQPEEWVEERLQSEERKKTEHPALKANLLFRQASKLYKQRKYLDAIKLLVQAINKDKSRAKYFHLLGLCQAEIPKEKSQAEFNLKKAARMEPWNADHVYALGEMYRSEGMLTLSKKYFKMALEINLDHTMAGKALGEFEDTASTLKPIFSVLKKGTKK